MCQNEIEHFAEFVLTVHEHKLTLAEARFAQRILEGNHYPVAEWVGYGKAHKLRTWVKQYLKGDYNASDSRCGIS